MALSDLRALAHRTPPAEDVTPVTRNPLPMGYGVGAQKTKENRQCQGAVTRVTPVTRDLPIAGVDDLVVPANDLVQPVADEAETAPPPADAPIPMTPQPARGQAAVQGLPDSEWVTAMAEALMANPVHRSLNPDEAALYWRGRALAMLDATPDPYARGLLLGFERHRHVKVVQFKPRGK